MPLNDTSAPPAAESVVTFGLDPLVDYADLADFREGMQADFEQQHYGSTGEHGAISCDSITARAANRLLPVTGVLQFLGGAWLLDEPGNNTHVAGLRPIQWTGRQDNYNPPGLRDALIVEVDTDADRSITGLQRHENGRQKRLLIFGNRGNYNITLEHNDSNSLYYNRFGLPNGTDLVLGANEYVWLYYDVGSEIWRVISVL